MTHRITISGNSGRVFVDCSCDDDVVPIYVIENMTITLDELNRLAHEHIEGADRAPVIR